MGKHIDLDSCVYSVAFSPSSQTIVAGLMDASVCVWDVSTGKVKVLHGHTSSVRSVVFSPDGTRIVSGSWDKSVCVWQNIEDPPWHVDSEGWIRSRGDSLRLMWFSRERLYSLLTPETAMVMSRTGYCTVSFEDCYFGQDWHRCYTP